MNGSGSRPICRLPEITSPGCAVTRGPNPYLGPPPELVPEAKEAWHLTATAFKPEWFAVEENLRTLERYCRAAALSRRLHKAIEAADLRGDDYKQFSRIHRALIWQANLMIRLADKLRIWPHQGR
jgi:hypothetical protein